MSRGGSIKKDQRTGGYYFVVDVAQPGEPRRQLKRRFRTYREARAALTEVLTDVDRGTFVRPDKLTLAGWVEQWLPVLRTRVRPSTALSYERNLRLHVLPRLGSRPLQSLRSGDLTALYAALLENGRLNHRGEHIGGLSPRSVQYIHTIASACLRAAVEGDLLQRSPAERAKPPRPEAGARRHEAFRAWTGAELAAFLERTTHQRHHAAWHLLAMTGLRRGEALALGWDAVDLEAGSVSVRRILTDVVAGEPVWSDPKTDRGRRLITLDTTTVAKLRAHRVAQAEERLAVGPGYRDLGLVFAMPDGRPVHPERFSREFVQTVARSGLPQIRLHDLRHTWASLALQAGVHPKVVQERLGHSNIAITLDIYSHLIPAMQTDAADRVAALVVTGGGQR